MNIIAGAPATRDLTQTKVKIKVPEIRVWCHPHRINETGDDYYKVFSTFNKALQFIKTHKEAEESPLVAIDGFEVNVFDCYICEAVLEEGEVNVKDIKKEYLKKEKEETKQLIKLIKAKKWGNEK